MNCSKYSCTENAKFTCFCHRRAVSSSDWTTIPNLQSPLFITDLMLQMEAVTYREKYTLSKCTEALDNINMHIDLQRAEVERLVHV